MENQNYTTSFSVNHTDEEVFNAINNVRGWWSEQIEGNTSQLNAVFDYHYQDVHRCKMEVVEFVPNQKVVWLVLENYFNFTKDKTEWTGNKISFEIGEKDGKTQLTFTHAGLVPAYECYEICADCWGVYVNDSLRSLIETGKGNPNPYIQGIQDAEALKATMEA